MKIRPLPFACVASISMAVVSIFAAAQTPAAPPSPTAPASAPAPVPAQPDPPQVVYKEGYIKVGDTVKQTLGKVTDVDKGDNGCYVTFKNESGAEFIELGKFEICSQKPPLKGKRVVLSYSIETIQAASCYGDPKCKKTETVPLVVAVKIVE